MSGHHEYIGVDDVLEKDERVVLLQFSCDRQKYISGNKRRKSNLRSRHLSQTVKDTCEKMQDIGEINPITHNNWYSDKEINEIAELFEVRRRLKDPKFCIYWEDVNGEVKKSRKNSGSNQQSSTILGNASSIKRFN